MLPSPSRHWPYLLFQAEEFFCLILIKVLPFNILPSSFQDEPVSQQELSQ